MPLEKIAIKAPGQPPVVTDFEAHASESDADIAARLSYTFPPGTLVRVCGVQWRLLGPNTIQEVKPEPEIDAVEEEVPSSRAPTLKVSYPVAREQTSVTSDSGMLFATASAGVPCLHPTKPADLRVPKDLIEKIDQGELGSSVASTMAAEAILFGRPIVSSSDREVHYYASRNEEEAQPCLHHLGTPCLLPEGHTEPHTQQEPGPPGLKPEEANWCGACMAGVCLAHEPTPQMIAARKDTDLLREASKDHVTFVGDEPILFQPPPATPREPLLVEPKPVLHKVLKQVAKEVPPRVGETWKPKDPRRKSGFTIKAVTRTDVVGEDGRTVSLERMKRYERVS